jgi:hypothetical protein
MLQSLDNKKIVTLVLLDLSAVFDTVEHHTLLCRMKHRFGVKFNGLALAWFDSYLKDRVQHVTVDNIISLPKTLVCGVLQGSVLAPQLFTMYTAPLRDIICHFGLSFPLYADNTQLYTVNPDQSSLDIEVARIERCIAEIQRWITQNFLKLNNDKTEYMLIASDSQLAKITPPSLHIGDAKYFSITTCTEPGDHR